MLGKYPIIIYREENMTSLTGKKPIKKVSKMTIGKGFKDNIGRLAKTISKGKRNEDETRRWIIDVLKEGLGYTEDDIETECTVLGKRADIVLMNGKQILAVIECKSANVQIKQTAINQAANYAIALGTEWAIATNGQSWGLYHVEQGKNNSPEIVELFSIELLDEDGISKDDISSLAMLENVWHTFCYTSFLQRIQAKAR